MATPEERMMENLYWWGIPTLFRCPAVTDLGQVDVGLIGVPHSAGNGTTEKDQHLGPRAVRNVSATARRVLDQTFAFSEAFALRSKTLTGCNNLCRFAR